MDQIRNRFIVESVKNAGVDFASLRLIQIHYTIYTLGKIPDMKGLKWKITIFSCLFSYF